MKDKLRIIAGFCIALSVILGFLRSIDPVREHEYVRYHLYGTALRTLALSIDRHLVILLAGLVLMSAVWRLGRVSRVFANRAFRSVGVAAVGAWLFFALRIRDLLTVDRELVDRVAGVIVSVYRDMAVTVSNLCKAETWRDTASESGAQLLLSTALLAGCAVYLAVGIRRRASERDPDAPRQAHARRVRAPLGERLTGCLPACRVVCLIFAVVFIGINVAAVGFRARNAVSLRGKPNILLIIVDTLRADHMGCYGYDRNTTPNLDAFARESIRFERAIAQAPWTRWSITSLLTSRYPETIYSGKGETACVEYLRNSHLTMAEILRDRGYATAGVVSNPQLSAKINTSQGYDTYDDTCAYVDNCASEVTDLAVKQIDEFGGDRFFLTVHYIDPHAPYVHYPKHDFYPDYTGSLSGPLNLLQWDNDMAAYSDDDVQYAVALYDANIRYNDEHIGTLLKALKDRGIYDDTLIAFVSDHGEEFKDHGYCLHAHTLYDELLHVPCLVKLPGQTSGRVVEGQIALIDILPSVLESTGSGSPHLGLHGQAYELSTVEEVEEKPIFSALKVNTDAWMRSVYKGTYKYIRNAPEYPFFPEEQLFNLAADEVEQTNLAKSPESEHVREFLDAELDKHRDLMSSSSVHAPVKHVNVDEADRERLRSLGYL